MRKAGFNVEDIWSPYYGATHKNIMKKGKHDRVERAFGENGKDSYRVSYRGNEIADINPFTKKMKVTDAGWQTNTTKARLNKLLSSARGMPHIYQKNFKWYVKSRGVSKPFKQGMEFDL